LCQHHPAGRRMGMGGLRSRALRMSAAAPGLISPRCFCERLTAPPGWQTGMVNDR
jgi:hypothetical protein